MVHGVQLPVRMPPSVERMKTTPRLYRRAERRCFFQRSRRLRPLPRSTQPIAQLGVLIAISS